VRLYRVRNRDQHAQALRNAAHAKAATDHSNRDPVISQWNSSSGALSEQMEIPPYSGTDHHEAQESNHISKYSRVHAIPFALPIKIHRADCSGQLATLLANIVSRWKGGAGCAADLNRSDTNSRNRSDTIPR
jgi:hypothetical protein